MSETGFVTVAVTNRFSVKIKADMTVDIGGIQMKNPVMVASGTFGYGSEYAEVVDVDRLGAVVVKGISMNRCEGNDTPRLVEVPGGLVNAIGLQNPGVEGFISEYLPYLRERDTCVIANIWGKSIDEYAGVAARLSETDGIDGLEVNISCPNIKEGGLSFGADEESAARVIAAVRAVTELPVIPKLPPNVPDIRSYARRLEDAGANALSLINSVPAMVIDIETRRPVLANMTGGLSGPAIHPIAVKLVWEAAQAVDVPIIGMGGIMNAEEAVEFILAGATAVAVGTANFTDPSTSLSVIDGIGRYLDDRGFASVREAVGALKV